MFLKFITFKLLLKVSKKDTYSQCFGSGSRSGFAWIRNFCLDPDRELKFRIQIQPKVKEHLNKTVKSGLFLLLDSSIE